MPRSKTNSDGWDEIFDDLILDTEPPTRYIKDAVITTKSGNRFKVSADDFADIVAKERLLGPDQSEIQSCSISIDFTKIKREVNRWTNKFIESVEAAIAADIAAAPKKKRASIKRKVD
jgi:hypothetical protein